jgi:hypothetical protein
MMFVLAKGEGDLLQEVMRFRARAPNRSMEGFSNDRGWKLERAGRAWDFKWDESDWHSNRTT